MIDEKEARHAFEKWYSNYWGEKKPDEMWLADDGKYYYKTYLQHFLWCQWQFLWDFGADSKGKVKRLKACMEIMTPKPLGSKKDIKALNAALGAYFGKDKDNAN